MFDIQYAKELETQRQTERVFWRNLRDNHDMNQADYVRAAQFEMPEALEDVLEGMSTEDIASMVWRLAQTLIEPAQRVRRGDTVRFERGFCHSPEQYWTSFNTCEDVLEKFDFNPDTRDENLEFWLERAECEVLDVWGEHITIRTFIDGIMCSNVIVLRDEVVKI